jgi:hypothetical protein
MKKKKINGQQIKFFINMISIAIFAISYLYVYTGYVEKTEAAYKEIDATKQYMAAIEKKISEEDSIRQQTVEVDAQIQEIIDSYPVNITKIDNLMYAEFMQEELGINLTSIIPSDSSSFYDTILPIRNEDGTEVDQTILNAPTDNAAATEATTNANEADKLSTDSQTTSTEDLETTIADEAATPNTATEQTGESQNAAAQLQVMTGAQSTISMNFQTTYQGFKELVEYINTNTDKTIIDSISVNADSITGKLTGILVLKRFALTGTGKVYLAPVIDDISIGTDNIFGTDSTLDNETVPTNSETESPTEQ